jgi:hypothetical protein
MPGSTHRVVPVYIGEQGDKASIDAPYGLRILHSADLRTTSLDLLIENLTSLIKKC